MRARLWATEAASSTGISRAASTARRSSAKRRSSARRMPLAATTAPRGSRRQQQEQQQDHLQLACEQRAGRQRPREPEGRWVVEGVGLDDHRGDHPAEGHEQQADDHRRGHTVSRWFGSCTRPSSPRACAAPSARSRPSHSHSGPRTARRSFRAWWKSVSYERLSAFFGSSAVGLRPSRARPPDDQPLTTSHYVPHPASPALPL